MIIYNYKFNFIFYFNTKNLIKVINILDLINFIIKNLNNRIIIKIINKKKYFQ